IPKLAPVFMTWIICFVGITFWLSKVRLKYDLASANADSRTTGHMSDILLSIFTLRFFAATPHENKAYAKTTLYELQCRMRAWLLGNLQNAVQAILVISLELYCISTMMHEAMTGKETVGSVVLVQSYIGSLAMYLWNFGRSLIKVRTAFADAYEKA